MGTTDHSLVCDYLVVGAGASGMAFLDTLFLHHPDPKPSVVVVDRHAAPGGHWNDGYPFVTLHQSARNYGVESMKLEESVADKKEGLATRMEIIEYYRKVMNMLQAEHSVHYIPNASYDFSTGEYKAVDGGSSGGTISATTVVDARFTEPDLPVHVKPKFTYDPSKVQVVPPNELPAGPWTSQDVAAYRFCVIGAGKTGQDTILYLQRKLGVDPSHIAWVMPHQPWITARDAPTIDTSMEFLQACALASDASTASSVDYVQNGFLQLEKQGKVYRFDKSFLPTKFMNATLNRQEVDTILQVPPGNVIRNGRVAAITDSGDLQFADGTVLSMPWDTEGGTGRGSAPGTSTTVFVHCSAGAFNFSSSAAAAQAAGPPAVYAPGKITIREVFAYPGFCFNGSLIARLECEAGLSLEAKNAMTELPAPSPSPPGPLGPVAGDIGGLHGGHGLVIALRNALRWYAHPGLGEWLSELRLYSLTMNGYGLAEARAVVDAAARALSEGRVL